MDTKELVAQAKARYNHQQSRLALQAKYQSQLTLVYNGGLWDITIELLSLLGSTKYPTLILLDSYEKPVEVNVEQLRELMSVKYNEIMKAWLDEYTELSKLR